MPSTISPRAPLTDPASEKCPVTETLRILGGKHGANILHCLAPNELHFLELQRALNGISRKVLADQLRELGERGLVVRTPKPDARQRVGYSLTPKGRSLGGILAQLYDWQQAFDE